MRWCHLSFALILSLHLYSSITKCGFQWFHVWVCICSSISSGKFYSCSLPIFVNSLCTTASTAMGNCMIKSFRVFFVIKITFSLWNCVQFWLYVCACVSWCNKICIISSTFVVAHYKKYWFNGSAIWNVEIGIESFNYEKTVSCFWLYRILRQWRNICYIWIFRQKV